jgi:sugar phosphate isomerase/epimerase
MKASICNELYHDRSFEAACQSAAETGYQGIEIAPYTLAETVFEISPQQRRETVQAAARYDLKIVGLHWLLAKTKGLRLTSSNRDVRQRTLEYLKALVDLCSDLGAAVMVLGSPQQRYLEPTERFETGFAQVRDLLQALAPRLESRGVMLAVEPLGPEETNFLTTAESAVELIKTVGSTQLGLNLDVKAMSAERIPIPAIIEASQTHLVHFHANDPNRLGPGMGAVDFGPILNALKKVNYSGWVSVEVFDYSPGIDVIATQSLATLKQDGNTNQ